MLPVVHAMGNIHNGIIAGKLKGHMPAHTCRQKSSSVYSPDHHHSSTFGLSHISLFMDGISFFMDGRACGIGKGLSLLVDIVFWYMERVLTPKGCRMLYVSMPLDTFSMNSPLRSTARLHAYSTTSAYHVHHFGTMAAPMPGHNRICAWHYAM